MPKSTEVVPVKLAPEMVTVVPPVVGPELGEIEVIKGGGGIKPKNSAPIVGVLPSPIATQNVVLVQETP